VESSPPRHRRRRTPRRTSCPVADQQPERSACWSRSIRRLRACCTTQALVGWAVIPARCTVRRCTSTTNSTYSRIRPTVSTVKKSLASSPPAWARRNCVQVGPPRRRRPFPVCGDRHAAGSTKRPGRLCGVHRGDGPPRCAVGSVDRQREQFTGRFTKPRPAEVLFERICRENGIIARLTKPRSPTTTGKIERAKLVAVRSRRTTTGGARVLPIVRADTACSA
jgi:hypothetical protein